GSGVGKKDRTCRVATTKVELIERRSDKIRPRGTRLQDRRKHHSPRKIYSGRNGNVMPLIVEGWPIFKRRERLLWVAGIVPERRAVLVITLSLRQCVICD